MVALAATSRELRMSSNRAFLDTVAEYAGPQCFTQLVAEREKKERSEQVRLFANSAGARDHWIQCCGAECLKWHRVARDVASRYGGEGVDFRWNFLGRSCVQAGVSDTSRDGPCDVLRDCWLRCGKAGCGKWRLVEPGCLPSLLQTGFRKAVRGSEEDVWRTWLEEGCSRWDAFVMRRKAERVALGLEEEEEAAREDPED